MIPRSILSILILFLYLPLSFLAQSVSKPFEFPESIPGYFILICDFHMHTVFSDGLVWPTTRVDEAVSEGLDAIAISDHLEYWSHKNYVKGDHNTSYEIAKPYADEKGLILIRACEITKGMPPGHFNCLFIRDANAIDSVDWEKGVNQANEQGAFVFWNHPGWRQKDEIPIWYDEHSWLLSHGLIQGIEVVNENSYYPLAHQWAIDSNLCMLGNSDIHDPVDYFYDRAEGEHRPITLVFAKERSEEGIREALDNGRTAIFYKDMLMGDEWFIKELFYNSIEVFDYHNLHDDYTSEWGTGITNTSSIPLQLEMIYGDDEEGRTLILEPMQGIEVDFPTDDLVRKWRVNNFLIAPDRNLVLEYIRPY